MTAVRLFESPDELASTAALDAINLLRDLLQIKSKVHLCLTGGTVGVLTVKKFVDVDLAWDLDWSRIHIWWGDERFVAAQSSERNALQCFDAALTKLPIEPSNVHQFPALDDQSSVSVTEQLWAARAAFEDEVATQVEESGDLVFDLTLLGMGPDGHVASLFPGHEYPSHQVVVAEPSSPKPPPHRLSFSFEVLNRSHQLWFVVAGNDKAGAVGRALAGDTEIPAGRIAEPKIVWYLDRLAAGS